MTDADNNQSIPNMPQEKRGRSLEIWYKILFSLLLLTPAALLLLAFAVAGSLFIYIIFAILFGLLCIAVLCLALKKKNQIQSEGGAVRKDEFAIPGLITPAVCFISLAAVFAGTFLMETGIYSLGSDWRIGQVGRSVTLYSNNHNGRFPDADKWCDQLIESQGEGSLMYQKENANCPFALNENALTLGKDAPDDMVLIFPAKEGWNSSGGLELFQADSGSYFVKVFLAGGKTETIRPKDAENLRWSIDDKMNIPEPPAYASTSIGALICLSAAGVFLRKRSVYLRRRAGLAAFITVLSAGAGAGFAALAEMIFYSQHVRNYGIGWAAGGAAGIAAGAVFTGLLCKWKSESPEGFKLMGWATAAGALTGLLASSAAHLILMAAYDFFLPHPIMFASPFGTYSGLLLGGLSIVFLQELPRKNTQSIEQQ
ncbi:hypothetical protein [Sedimentisphaera salicampi]|uniref:Uncharacterized protein n=1 Tax=Sedimentisphaera salicampi TaxID=1941349 RepID=A0A1W6LMC8_9BACT|nr:hypothetical protein [Sedimentisphaera salicampi]ARN56906.1 hypothetical protein STSP1_01299 [Sedimentisphaera salicampi]